jgi:hypothetical protein
MAGHEFEIFPARMIKLGVVAFTATAGMPIAAPHRAPFSANVNLKVDSAKHQLHAGIVVDVSIVKERGIYSPHTRAANLVINDVLVSCYTKESGTYEELVKLLPDSQASLKHWITQQASLATVLRHLHNSVLSGSCPR